MKKAPQGAFFSTMRYIIFDTETTGVGPDKQAVEFALLEIDPDTLQPLGECGALVKPTCPVSPEAAAIHGISDEMLQGCPTIQEWIDRELGGPLEGEVTLIGHRVGFDQPLFAPFGNVVRTLDTLSLAFEYVRGAPNKKLSTLKEFLHLDGGGQDHRAMADVVTCHQLLMHLCSVTGRTLEQLITTPYIVHYWPWGKHEGKLLSATPRGYREFVLREFTDLEPNLRHSLELVGLMDPPYQPVVKGAKPKVVIPPRRNLK